MHPDGPSAREPSRSLRRGRWLAAPLPGDLKAGGGISLECFGSSGGKNVSGIRGVLGVTPGELFARISGVIITTSSVRSFCAAWLWKSSPRIGMSPMPGTFWSVLFIELLSRPATANVCPFDSSSSVSVRRVVSAGIRKPLSTTALLKSSALTSGRTFKWTRSPLTIGVNVNRMPNSLY